MPKPVDMTEYVRATIRREQAGTIRNLRKIWAPECTCDADLWRGRKHSAMCERRDFDRELKDLLHATRPGWRRK